VVDRGTLGSGDDIAQEADIVEQAGVGGVLAGVVWSGLI
jgi:hypothetical protein